MKRSPAIAACLIVLGAICHEPVWSQERVEIADMDLGQLAQVKIEAATGIPKPISEAPAVASVITAEQIEAMGALTVDEVLETVPGLHVSLSENKTLDPIYSIRGIQSADNAQVLLMVDSVPITQVLNGGPVLGFRMPVASVARIEVVRGPGSAVFGADAFAGVINIITKRAGDIEGTEVGLRLGTFDTAGGWAQYGARHAGWDLAVSVEWLKTEGDRDRIVARDVQSGFDDAFGTSASRAPGPLEMRYDLFNAHLALDRGRWRLNLWGWLGEDRGNGAGLAQALDPGGRMDSELALSSVEYRDEESFIDWNLQGRLSHVYLDQSASSRLFPEGALLPIGSDGNLDFTNPVGLVSFPDGLIGDPGATENTTSLDLAAIFTGSSQHRVRIGAGAMYQDVNPRESKNFGPGVIDGTQPVVDGTTTDVTGTELAFVDEQVRKHWYLSAQDEWFLSHQLEATLGVRYDQYSDFGSTVNPRLALVWSRSRELIIKALYGTAFRAPSLTQQLGKNNPARLGNPDLEPEEIRTAELVVDYWPSNRVRTAISLFSSDIKGLIDVVPDEVAVLPNQDSTLTAQNARDQKGHGIELETAWEASRRLLLQGSLAWQDSEDADTGQAVHGVPRLQGHASVLWRPDPGWSVYGRLVWIDERLRAEDDPRPPLEGYTRVDLTVRRKRIAEHWDLALMVRNLLDESAFEPSGLEIPGDLPLEGRSVVFELRYHD